MQLYAVLNPLCITWLVCCLLLSASGLYEDQIGEFDWHREGLGVVTSAAFPAKSTKSLYVATEANVIAKVDAKSSYVLWRHVIPAEEFAVDQLVFSDVYGALVSISGKGSIVRGWDAVSGHLNWEVHRDDPSDSVHALELSRSNLVVVVRLNEVFAVNINTGSLEWSATIENNGIGSIHSCKLSFDGSRVFILASNLQDSKIIYAVDVKEGSLKSIEGLNNLQSIVTLYNDEDEDRVVAVGIDDDKLHLQGLYDTSRQNTITADSFKFPNVNKDKISFKQIISTVQNAFVLQLSTGKRVFAKLSSALTLEIVAVLPKEGLLVDSIHAHGVLFHISFKPNGNALSVTSHSSIESANNIQMNAPLDLQLYGNDVHLAYAGVSLRKKSASTKCQIAVVMQDHSLILLTNSNNDINQNAQNDLNSGDLAWIREESLSQIKHMHWVTPAEVASDHIQTASIPTFFEELTSESLKLQYMGKRIYHSLFNPLGSSNKQKKKDALVLHSSKNSHFFGFSKLLVILTRSGKLFALNSESGEVVWSKFLGVGHQLIVTRDHPALGTGGEIVLLSSNEELIQIDADTGLVLNEQTLTSYMRDNKKAPKWLVLTPKLKHHDGEELATQRSVAVVNSETLQVDFIPPLANNEHISQILNHFYFTKYDKLAQSFNGYNIIINSKLNQYFATVVWSVSAPLGEKLVSYTKQPEQSVVDSAVIITGDDSLLLKYLNPHLFAIATLAKKENNSNPGGLLTVSLIDSVSGRIIHRAKHSDAAIPVNMVQSENWLVYSYYNTKHKRTEMVSVSLFDGAIGTHGLNPWKRPVWTDIKSSYEPKLPIVLQKNFIFPVQVTSLSATRTARGITPQYILVGMASGQIFKLARHFIDPRVPDTPPTIEQQSEGLMQYNPHVLVYSNPFAMVSYNKSIIGIKEIVSSPAILESTSLTFAYGLDLFYVRLAPANAFDLLPSDFNYELLVVLCLGFVLASYLSNKLASRKMLHDAWK